MTSATVLRDVSLSLKSLLQTYIHELRSDDAIVFQSPGAIGPSDKTQLSLFLYKSDEDPYMRNDPGALSIDKSKRTWQQTSPPMILNLRYMLVPMAQHEEMVLVLVNQIRQVFYTYAVLIGDLLQGSLPQTGNTKIDIVPEFPALNEISQLWEDFGDKAYRQTLFYSCVPVRLPSLAPQQSGKLATPEVHYHQLDLASPQAGAPGVDIEEVSP